MTASEAAEQMTPGELVNSLSGYVARKRAELFVAEFIMATELCKEEMVNAIRTACDMTALRHMADKALANIKKVQSEYTSKLDSIRDMNREWIELESSICRVYDRLEAIERRLSIIDKTKRKIDVYREHEERTGHHGKTVAPD